MRSAYATMNAFFFTFAIVFNTNLATLPVINNNPQKYKNTLRKQDSCRVKIMKY